MSINLFGLTDQELAWVQSGKLDYLSDETMARLQREYPEEFADFAAMAPLLTRHTHLTGDEVNAYLNADPFGGELTPESRVYIEAHLAKCDLCRDVVEASREFFFQAESPQINVSSLAPIFLELNTNMGATTMRGSGMSYRGNRRGAVVTLRGNTPEPLAFEKDDVTVFIELEVHDQVRILRGQLLADIELDDETAGTVEIRQEDAVVASVPLDEMGMFVAELQISGIFDIHIIIDGYPEIIIEQIAIEETG